jgi:hypothetical protein
LELNGTNQILVNADEITLLDDIVNNIKENTGTLSGASRDVRYFSSSEFRTEPEYKGKLMNRLKMWQDSNNVTNQNDIHDEVKTRLNSGNACYHPF